MARIEIAPRGDRQILGSRTATGKTLRHTRTALKIDHKVEEIKIFSALMTSDHLNCQLVILLEELRQILLPDCVRLLRLRHNRLHRNLLESEICKMQHILREIKIIMCKGSSHIIFILMSALRELLELRHDQIIASRTLAERPHLIVNFLPSVNT